MTFIWLAAGAAIAALVSYLITRPRGGIIRGAFGTLAGSLAGLILTVIAVLAAEPVSQPDLRYLAWSTIAGGFLGILFTRYRRKRRSRSA
jgi:presenilin-like A22 family membrane protease